MKKYLLIPVLLACLVGLAWGEECWPPPEPCKEPCVESVRLITQSDTVLVVSFTTPFKVGMYKVKYKIFNSMGVLKREGNSGWFTWSSGNKVTYEHPIEPNLRGQDYFVRVSVLYAGPVHNE